ncbi:MAG TPA: class I SAM-dependent methyltransferase [Thermoanaerobaculia bacterium]|nr:class I SAM-dependent methyltransferase [Thermoanaerobaculia bacterium]
MRTDSRPAPGFPDEAPGLLFAVKDGHFWFTHRRLAIREAARSCLPGAPRARVLDLGCGDGEILAELSRHFHAVGLDPRVNDLSLARRRGATRLVAAQGDHPPFSRCFDLVGLFDVLEHVADDSGLLGRAAALAVPGGFVLLTVPADPRLWSKFDRYAGHYRRYTRRVLEGLLRDAGLEPVRILPLFRILWPLARIQALFGRRQEVADPEREYRVTGIWNHLLRAALAVERRLSGASERGIGTSWLAVARIPAVPTRPPTGDERRAASWKVGPGSLSLPRSVILSAAKDLLPRLRVVLPARGRL